MKRAEKKAQGKALLQKIIDDAESNKKKVEPVGNDNNNGAGEPFEKFKNSTPVISSYPRNNNMDDVEVQLLFEKFGLHV